MKYDKIVGLKKQQEKENLEIIQREIDAMLRRKERISITTLAKYAGVDRSYFYRNLQAKQMVEDAQLKQGNVIILKRQFLIEQLRKLINS